MFFHRHNEDHAAPIYGWLVANKERILDGSAEYQGTAVHEKTVLRQYVYVVSPGAFCISIKTPHMLPTKDNNYLAWAAIKYSLVSLVAGWWCFPWGPAFTLQAIYLNLTGGIKHTAIGVLQLIEWGWDASADAGVEEYLKDLVDLTANAALEIEARRMQGQFPDGIGIRITPTKWADAEVQVAFDYPVSDGRFWVGKSQGMTLIIDKEDELQLGDCTIDYADGRFVAVRGRRKPPEGY